MKFYFLCAMLALALCGCVSYEYTGSKAQPTENVTIFANRESVTEKFKLLGMATVSGNYQNVSRQMLLEKLQSEAGKNGANGVIIVEDRVIPGKSQSGQPLFYTAFDYDDMERSWRQLYRDVDANFAGKDQIETMTSYKRIIKAEFVEIEK